VSTANIRNVVNIRHWTMPNIIVVQLINKCQELLEKHYISHHAYFYGSLSAGFFLNQWDGFWPWERPRKHEA